MFTNLIKQPFPKLVIEDTYQILLNSNNLERTIEGRLVRTYVTILHNDILYTFLDKTTGEEYNLLDALYGHTWVVI